MHRDYNSDEVNEILKRAAEFQANKSSSMTFSDLREIGEESGIDEESIRQAIVEQGKKQQEKEKAQPNNLPVEIPSKEIDLKEVRKVISDIAVWSIVIGIIFFKPELLFLVFLLWMLH